MPGSRPRPRTSSRSCVSCVPRALRRSSRKASGTSRARPELARLLNRLCTGDTLVVVRIDRLARSLPHLLSVIERVRHAGGDFRSLGDPIDTAGPSGMLVLQIMGAVAEFERSLIVERTKAGLAAARAQGRVGGNPALRSARAGGAAQDRRSARADAAGRAAAHGRCLAHGRAPAATGAA